MFLIQVGTLRETSLFTRCQRGLKMISMSKDDINFVESHINIFAKDLHRHTN